MEQPGGPPVGTSNNASSPSKGPEMFFHLLLIPVTAPGAALSAADDSPIDQIGKLMSQMIFNPFRALEMPNIRLVLLTAALTAAAGAQAKSTDQYLVEFKGGQLPNDLSVR